MTTTAGSSLQGDSKDTYTGGHTNNTLMHNSDAYFSPKESNRVRGSSHLMNTSSLHSTKRPLVVAANDNRDLNEFSVGRYTATANFIPNGGQLTNRSMHARPDEIKAFSFIKGQQSPPPQKSRKNNDLDSARKSRNSGVKQAAVSYSTQLSPNNNNQNRFLTAFPAQRGKKVVVATSKAVND